MDTKLKEKQHRERQVRVSALYGRGKETVLARGNMSVDVGA